jgi:hypothetical protein
MGIIDETGRVRPRLTSGGAAQLLDYANGP